MSLQDIRAMRMRRVKPSGWMSVIVGKAPKFCKTDADVIELPPGCQPGLMDWRPVVGLWVSFYLVDEDWAVMDAAVKAAEAAGGKLLGFAARGKAYPLANFADTETEQKVTRLMCRELEALCQ